jgi:hypothetical protein
MKVVTCRVHGDLIESQAIKCMDKHNAYGVKWKCTQCWFEKKKKNLEKHIASGFKKPEVIKGICKKHGELDETTGFICVDKSLSIGYRIRCKKCNHNIQANSYLINKDREIKRASEWKKNNRDKINEATRKDRKENPEKYKKWENDFYNRNREELSLKMSLKERKIDKDFYDKMVIEQDNKCAICGMEETRKARNGEVKTRLCIDHDHDTNKVRALLCHDCNTGIGKFKDVPELVLKAADYLIFHKGWTV